MDKESKPAPTLKEWIRTHKSACAVIIGGAILLFGIAFKVGPATFLIWTGGITIFCGIITLFPDQF